MDDLGHGAVAMLDALGIKGTYERSIVETLRAMKGVAEGMRDYCNKALIPRVLKSEFVDLYDNEVPRVEVLAVSDTLIISAQLPHADVDQHSRSYVDALLVDVVGQCAAYVMRKAPQASRKLTYRGVVTCGDLLVDHPFFLGPAIDEAACLYEKADGAFLWLAPSAAAQARHHRPYIPHVWESMAVPYEVPLKQGVEPTIALSPYVDLNPDVDEVAAIRAGVLCAMDDPRPDVARKRENTIRFLEEARFYSRRQVG